MAGLTLEEPAGGQHIVPEADRIIVLWIKGKPRYLRVLALCLNPLVSFQKLNGSEFEELFGVLFSHVLTEMKRVWSSFLVE
jgi:hypothetical protein